MKIHIKHRDLCQMSSLFTKFVVIFKKHIELRNDNKRFNILVKNQT